MFEPRWVASADWTFSSEARPLPPREAGPGAYPGVTWSPTQDDQVTPDEAAADWAAAKSDVSDVS